MYLEEGVCGDNMIIEMSGHSGIKSIFDVIKMSSEPFDNDVFGFAYIVYRAMVA